MIGYLIANQKVCKIKLSYNRTTLHRQLCKLLGSPGYNVEEVLNGDVICTGITIETGREDNTFRIYVHKSKKPFIAPAVLLGRGHANGFVAPKTSLEDFELLLEFSGPGSTP